MLSKSNGQTTGNTSVFAPASNSTCLEPPRSTQAASHLSFGGLERVARPGRFGARAEFLMARSAWTVGHVITSGWAYTYELMADGRRQVLFFLLPGDYLGPHPWAPGPCEYSACAVTDLETLAIPIDQLRALSLIRNETIDEIMRAKAQDHAILLKRVSSLGRMSAYERLVHLMLELFTRLELKGLLKDREFDLPVTQEILADALGLSVVHINRTLRRLHKDGLVTVNHGHVVIHDLERMMASCEFDPSYLTRFQENDPSHAGASPLSDSERAQACA